MLRKIRISLAVVFWVGITLLFLDFTGTAHRYLGWMVKLQFLPAVLALNVAVVAGLIVLTLLLGRIYCSVVCPMGVMQDIIAWVSKRRLFRKNKRAKLANKYTYSPTRRVLRALVLLLFLVLMIAGLNSLAILIAPYSAYGRIATNLMQPVWLWGNNLLAALAEHYDSYAFYSVDVWVRSGISLAIAVATLLIVGILAWRGGRTYCNTICPVGTVLGYVSHFSLHGPVFDKEKCNGCRLCERNCKAGCINVKEHHVDMTRCVSCGNCMALCPQGSMHFGNRFSRFSRLSSLSSLSSLSRISSQSSQSSPSSPDRRAFVKGLALVTSAATFKAAAKTVDGGLAAIEKKQLPERKTRLTPPGSLSVKHFSQHCTACQLCIAECPNQVLRPSNDLEHLMQPVMQYDLGYCRPECTRCSQLCPAGAIRPITREEKTAQQIGHAVWIKQNCLTVTEGVDCGNCARHCPTGAIEMVPLDENEEVWVPAVNESVCIGCGACENLCPARPISAIYVEGYEAHRQI